MRDCELKRPVSRGAAQSQGNWAEMLQGPLVAGDETRHIRDPVKVALSKAPNPQILRKIPVTRPMVHSAFAAAKKWIYACMHTHNANIMEKCEFNKMNTFYNCFYIFDRT